MLLLKIQIQTQKNKNNNNQQRVRRRGKCVRNLISFDGFYTRPVSSVHKWKTQTSHHNTSDTNRKSQDEHVKSPLVCPAASQLRVIADETVKTVRLRMIQRLWNTSVCLMSNVWILNDACDSRGAFRDPQSRYAMTTRTYQSEANRSFTSATNDAHLSHVVCLFS